MSPQNLRTGADVRRACRKGEWTGPTAALAPRFAQANLVVLPRDSAFHFLLFCQRNHKSCPVLEVSEPESHRPEQMAPDADLRTDLPRYRVWEDGELVDEPNDVTDRWRDDLVSFLIGCSFTFDSALLRAGLPVRHIEQGCNVPMYRTSRRCAEAGPFRGPLVVSMRPMRLDQAREAAKVTARFPHFHGGPVQIGDASGSEVATRLGITDLSKPDFGDAVEIRPGEIPVFWACGVTPQCALMEAKLPFAITHAPGHMFVTDRSNESVLESH